MAGYTLALYESPFACALRNRADGRLIWQLQAVRARRTDGVWLAATDATLQAPDAGAAHLRLTAGDTPLDLHASVAEDVLRFEIAAAGDVEWLAADLLSRPDEHYLGLGERFDALDQRGKQVDLWVVNGAQEGRTYIPVPFFQSTAGYGLHVDTDVRCLARLATHDDPAVVSIRNAAPTLSMTVIPGETPKAILSRYTAIAGRPAVPPPWVFGPWKSRDWKTEDQETVYEDADRQRELRLPATVKLIDARWEPTYHTFTFDRERYPDPEGMISHLHNLGYRLVLWISPWMVLEPDRESPYQFCAERGYLITNSDGDPYLHRLGNSPTFFGTCFDFTNPEAVDWWQKQIARLVKMGVSGFKTDFGEQVPVDAHFHDGRTGREMHNVYPRLYNQVTYEAMQQEGDGVLLARSGWHGSQALSAVWAGDQTADYAPASGLPSAILAGQSAGLTGFPYWASDVGGYFGVPTDETFMRWSQFGAFSPIMQIHGAGRREPWTFSEETLDVYRRYAALHIDLFPYIYTYAHEATRSGLPIMRALALEFPDDPGVWGDVGEHAYCFGRELLVAPVYYGFSRLRYLYLPRGRWRDFWTGESLDGGRMVERPAPLDQMPIFARAGAIIPRLDPPAQTLLPAASPDIVPAGDDLRLDVYTGEDGGFLLYDGTEFRWNEETAILTAAGSPVSRRISVRLVGDDRPFVDAIEGDGATRSTSRGSLGGQPEYVRVALSPDGELRLRWQRAPS
ncbi:MAG: glycoside hydrolase family 31 protein [Candidatus Promineifilaceae bacterium]|nr:glycoside hydrolase family 31 protein [Candidatus Promineifilaceae bacterium]